MYKKIVNFFLVVITIGCTVLTVSDQNISFQPIPQVLIPSVNQEPDKLFSEDKKSRNLAGGMGDDNISNTAIFNFGGSCSSQGAWTQNALTQTNKIRDVLQALKDNPACKAPFETIKSSLESMSNNLKDAGRLEEQVGPGAFSNFGSDIAALRSFAKEPLGFQKQSLRLLFAKSMARHSHTSEQKTPSDKGADKTTVQDLEGIARRMRNAVLSGLNFYNSTVSTFSSMDANCLDSSASKAVVVSGLLQTLTAFAGVGAEQSGLTSAFSQAVNNYFELLRQEKYALALGQINERQFISSLSCLLESTAEQYCSAIDAQEILNEIMRGQNIKVEKRQNSFSKKEEVIVTGESKNFQSNMLKGPLAGYYILSRQVAIVTEWLRKLQYGNTPQIPTEATFQVGIVEDVIDSFNSVKRIQGNFNKQVNNFMAFSSQSNNKSDISLKAQVFEMVVGIAQEMSRGGAGRGRENFFVKAAGDENTLFFNLLGMDVPNAVLGRGGANETQFTNNASGWLQANYRSLPVFNDPKALVDVVNRNMDELFRKAEVLANAYYSQYFIADKAQVIGNSLLGMDSNVRDSLSHIDNYLEDLYNRISQSPKDSAWLPLIYQTRVRIGKVLSRYHEIHSLGLKMSADPKAYFKDKVNADLDKELRRLGDELIKEVYQQFQILQARAGWLENRMRDFVMFDYTMSVKKRDQLDPYLNDLLLSTGYDALRSLVKMSEINYAQVNSDVAFALNIHRENIAALERASKSIFQKHIIKLGRVVEGHSFNHLALTGSSAHDIWASHHQQNPLNQRNSLQRNLSAFLNTIGMTLFLKNSEIYGQPNAQQTTSGAWDYLMGNQSPNLVRTNQYDSAETEKSLLCAQTMSFYDVQPFYYFCKKSVLNSPFINKDNSMKSAEFQKLAQEYLSIPYARKLIEGLDVQKLQQRQVQQQKDLAFNLTKRTCALRDYYRRNEIARITASMKDDLPQETIFTKPEDKITENKEEHKSHREIKQEVTNPPVQIPPDKGDKNEPKGLRNKKNKQIEKIE